MGTLYDLQEPIAHAQLTNLCESLESLRVNILQGHGRDYSTHIFLQFKTGK